MRIALRMTVLVGLLIFMGGAAESAMAQGTKDPSTPVPPMVFPIRPRDEPAPPRRVIVPNSQPPPIWLEPNYPVRVVPRSRTNRK